MTRWFIAGTALACAIALPAQVYAQSQTPCGPRAAIVQYLKGSYGEQTVAVGLAHSGAAIEIFVNREKGTWSVLLTAPAGYSCFVATGEHWESVDRPTTATVHPMSSTATLR